ncbi:uncharacterized protein TNCV_2052921 [Trichonephila clavipes]|nr:uncharacterized protein TNCV_2052921 [Trichonephila clavipes]
MLRTSQKKFAPAQIGDTVRIQVSDINRGCTDNRNVLAVVVGIEDSDFYKLANENGTLKQLYTQLSRPKGGVPHSLRNAGLAFLGYSRAELGQVKRTILIHLECNSDVVKVCNVQSFFH